MTVQVKNGYKLFWREKTLLDRPQTALFPSHILRKMQKQNNSQGSCMEIMGAAGHGVYRHLWAVRARSQLPLLVDC